MPSKKKTPTFEEDMERLEEIAEEMEEGDVPLEKLCALFDEGTRLSESLKKRLEAASCRLKIVSEGAEGIQTEDSSLTDGEIPAKEDEIEEEDEEEDERDRL